MSVIYNVEHHVKVFTFLKIIGDGEICFGDDEGRPNKDFWFGLNKIFLNNEDIKIEYRINNKEDRIYVYKNGKNTNVFHKNDIIDKIDDVLDALNTSRDPFSIPSVKKFLNEIHYTDVISKDSDASILSMELHNPRTGKNTRQHFRILSHYKPLLS